MKSECGTEGGSGVGSSDGLGVCREAHELAGKLFFSGHLKYSDDDCHKIIQTAFDEHDARICEEFREAMRSGLDAYESWRCAVEAMGK